MQLPEPSEAADFKAEVTECYPALFLQHLSTHEPSKAVRSMSSNRVDPYTFLRHTEQQSGLLITS